MAWIILFVAGVLEVAWAVGLKLSEGFTKPLIAAGTLVCMIASVALLAIAMRTIALGTAYAVWTGIGAVGAVVIGMVFFNEPKDALRILCLILILSGIVGLKVLAPTSDVK